MSKPSMAVFESAQPIETEARQAASAAYALVDGYVAVRDSMTLLNIDSLRWLGTRILQLDWTL